MHPNNESVTTVFSHSMSRRSLVALSGSLAFAALLPTWGCSLLGIEDPSKNTAAQDEPPVGSVDFEHLVFSIDPDPNNWWWGQLDNASSHLNGPVVVGIPVSVQNDDEITRVLNYMYVKVVSPTGEAQADLSPFYGDDILQHGSIYPGDGAQGVLHVLYTGPGTYTIQFDNLLGSKAQLEVAIDGSAVGIRAIPPGNLSEADVAAAIPYGTQFEVSGLTIELSADEASYEWVQTWDEWNEAWYGRWCVGVPMWIANHNEGSIFFTIDMYGLFGPDLVRMEDPAPYFEWSAGYVGEVPPGEIIETRMYWPYNYDGYYYAAFDNNGSSVVAAVRLAQY